MTTALPLDEFLDAVNRLGGDIATWPSDLRAPAEVLLSTSAEARRHLLAMQCAETLLAETRVAALANSNVIAQRAIQHRQDRGARPAVRNLSVGTAAALVFVLGIYVGGVTAAADAPDEAIAAALSLGDGADGG